MTIAEDHPANAAELAAENARLRDELRETQEQQVATADILRIIASTPGDPTRALDKIAETAARMFHASDVSVQRIEGDRLRHIAIAGPDSATVRRMFPEIPLDPVFLSARSVIENRQIVTDGTETHASKEATARGIEIPPSRMAFTPLKREGTAIGALVVSRPELQPYNENELELMHGFADQAVIAIENARLLTELRESLDRQTATSEVLSVISLSAGALEPVFRSVLKNALRMCEAQFGGVLLIKAGMIEIPITEGLGPEFDAYFREPQPTDPVLATAQAATTRVPVQVPDLREYPGYRSGHPWSVALVERCGARTMLFVPLIHNNDVVGTINIFRQEVQEFTEKQVELLRNFAAQAVIAIENARLLIELRTRTDELTESLEQQTATSEVLSVISSSPGDLKPVFEAMLENAIGICGAHQGWVHRFDGVRFYEIATTDALDSLSPPIAAIREQGVAEGFQPPPGTGLRRLMESRRTIHITDIANDPAFHTGMAAIVREGGARTYLAVPMLRDGELIGDFILQRRVVQPFSEKQIEVVENFASQAVIAIENARLLSELRESLDRQTATSEVLSVISSSPGEVRPVFSAVLDNVVRICDARFATLFLVNGNLAEMVASTGMAPEDDAWFRQNPQPFVPGTGMARLAETRAPVHMPDSREDEAYKIGAPWPVRSVDRLGARTVLLVPMIREDDLAGIITVYRQEVRPFADKQIELVENFAKQAVIAIENARLLTELRETLDRQTATSEVLSVISSSPGELEPVFEAMLDNAIRLCEATQGGLLLYEDGVFRRAARQGIRADVPSPFDHGVRPEPGTGLARLVETNSTIHIPDITEEAAYRTGDPTRVVTVRAAGMRTYLAVPLMNDRELVGAFTLYRTEVRPFTDKQVAVVENFAAQAVIAIENARLLTELRESLDRQTATAEVLGVISSSPGDVTPVFDTILDGALRLCEADLGVVFRVEEDVLHLAGTRGASPEYVDAMRAQDPYRAAPDGPPALVIRRKEAVQIEDARLLPAYLRRAPGIVAAVELGGTRTSLMVPMIQDDDVIGLLVIYRREVRPFVQKHIDLLADFAKQAVIAIQNARLLTELRESLDRQTATSEVLGVISSSPGELQPVFETMLDNALRLCKAKFGTLGLREGDGFRLTANLGLRPEHYARGMALARNPGPRTALGRVLATRRTEQLQDLRASDAFAADDPYPLLGREFGVESVLCVPMLRDGELIGAITIFREEPHAFTEKQVVLVENFAKQAVIAIENARLLTELRESLDRQMATSEVLGVISSSPGDLKPVFETMLENAVRLCEATQGALYRVKDGVLYQEATRGISPELVRWAASGWTPPPDSSPGRALLSKTTAHTHDIATLGNATSGAAVDLGGIRTALCVPMVKDQEVVGAFTLHRREVRPFTDKQIELVENFAKQAVIAIENARLLTELRTRTHELTESLGQQTATSEVLGVISASPGDLKPVFETMLENAIRICHADFGILARYHGDGHEPGFAMQGVPRAFGEFLESEPFTVAPPGLRTPESLRQTVHIIDAKDDDAYLRERNPMRVAAVELGGARTFLRVPLVKGNEQIGGFALYRKEVRPFTDKQIALVENFASQAVIAIENARLLTELRESLEQQTATSEVLGVISASPGELTPVFDTILQNALRACGAKFGALYRHDGSAFELAASLGTSEALAAFHRERGSFVPGPHATLTRVLKTKQTLHVTDFAADVGYLAGEAGVVAAVESGGVRSTLQVPLLKDETVIGVFTLHRSEIQPFSPKQIELVESFAAQAVIAIENARLLTELRESLDRQTATSEVLGVISASPGALEPVFETMLDNAVRICEASIGQLWRRDGDNLVRVADRGVGELAPMLTNFRPHPQSDFARIFGTLSTVHTPDLRTSPEYRLGVPGAIRLVDEIGVRAVLHVPLVREGDLVGVFDLYRNEPRPFDDKQIELVENFAAQAVIAIENARLLTELRESLDRQTATADILRVIASTPDDPTRALNTIAETAARMFDASSVGIRRLEGQVLRVVSIAGPAATVMRSQLPDAPLDHSHFMGPCVTENRQIHVENVAAATGYGNSPEGRIVQQNYGTGAYTPLTRDSRSIGAMVVARSEVRPFSDKELELMRGFADQAVIAIENARLLSELRSRTDELGRSVGELKALGEVIQTVNSTLDLQTVLTTIVSNSVRLSQTEAGAIYVADEAGDFHLRATHGMDERLTQALQSPQINVGENAIGDAVASRVPVQIPDLYTESRYVFPGSVAELMTAAGFRALLVMPLMRPDRVVGALVVRRKTPGAFSPATVELLETFAAQSVIAIQNARLFQEIEEKGRQLAEASKHKSQFLANMSHELRTPLNAILGYTDLILDDIYGAAPAEMREVLERVEANGRHLLGLINDVLDLSKIEAGQLVLAFQDYSIKGLIQGVYAAIEPLATTKGLALTLDIPQGLAAAHGDERRLAQVLLNLVGNALKFTDAGGITISARAEGDSYTVAVKDTGPGIALADQAKIFEEFQQADNSATRKKGGTGLGLAISKRIVEMHGGRIWVESVLGHGSIFSVSLPIRVQRQVAP